MNSTPDLALDAWRATLADLAQRCAAAPSGQAGDLVLALHDLLAAAPRGAGWALPARAAIEDLAAAGAQTSAVLVMIEHQAGYMLSHGPGGDHLATVALPGGVEVSAEGAHSAIALVGAMAGALAGPGLDHGQAVQPSAPQGLRLN